MGPAASSWESVVPQFDDRVKGEEARYALSAEMAFKAEARRNRLFGIWAAELMGLEGDAAKAYAADVVAADFTEAGDEDVFRKVADDLKAKGLNVPDALIRQKMAQLVAVAKQQIVDEQ
jgi:hypothetical protein